MNAPEPTNPSLLSIYNSQFALRWWSLVRWVLPFAGLLAFLGYVGPWVDHKVAGLAILGLDLGEYVKFLPAIRSGSITLWREGFYAPLVAISLSLSLCAYRRELRYPWPVRYLLLAGAAIMALNMLPPAWTPQRMLTPEFYQQSAAILVCLCALALSPFLALLPARLTGALIVALSLIALFVPIEQFLRVLPGISTLYRQPLTPGWGIYAMAAGLALLFVLGAIMVVHKSSAHLPTNLG